MTAAAAIMPARQSAQRRRLWAVIGLTGPAYVWLAFTVLLPLSAMLYFSFLTVAPIGARIAEPTLDNYLDFFRKGFYVTLTGRNELRSFRIDGRHLRADRSWPTVRQPNDVSADTVKGRVVVAGSAEGRLQFLDVDGKS